MNNVETLYLYTLVHVCATMYNHHHAHIHMYIHADQTLSLEKTEVLKNALMTSQYAKLSNFPDTPLLC